MSLHFIAGGAGFIGVNLAAALLDRGHQVLVADDLSRGTREAMAPLESRNGFSFVEVDCSDPDLIDAALGDRQIDEVWHMAANSDIPAGVADYRVDLRQTFLTTAAILDVMSRRGIPVIHFASSSAIYGDHGDRAIFEDIGPLQPISNYGAMKLASEAQLRAAKEAYLERVSVFRFPNVIGVPATHGVILDFVQKLIRTPDDLQVLGDGTQQKSYLHVSDLIGAMLHIADRNEPYAVYNIGPTDEGVTVRFIAETVRDAFRPAAQIHFGEGNRGWVGDVPKFRYSVDKLMETGWTPELGSTDAVLRAVREIVAQEAP
ncbi:NAD-dependent epimerase/dehydratase family protein [Novosphingobium soli]|uniref:NAD-dependent epimerase/dehydratase family protein n=1 Tax=Novosphingobium soli TaxID=574956 RepID=A0ABV6CTV2_9SPHN